MDVLDRNRVDAGKGFVEHDKLGIDSQAARYLRTPALAARQLIALVLPYFLQTELGNQAFELLFLILAGTARHFEHGGDVVLDAHLAEHRGFLRQVADALFCPLVDRSVRNVLFVKKDAASVGHYETCRHVERRRFACSVRTEQADDFALLDVERDVVDDGALSVLLDEQQAQTISIHTFHSLCFSILKENYTQAGLPQDFRVITEEEKALYNNDIPDNLLAFDDLIELTIKLFENHPEILKEYQTKFKYISVDEYQDIDENQYKLIKMLATNDTNMCIIGDPNQAIYGFRGGDSKFFNNFTQDYPDVETVNLKNNYRSAKDIVNASNQMIESFNTISKCSAINNKITIHTAPTEKSEAEFIVSTIENLIGGHNLFSIDSDRTDGQSGDFSFGDIAILYRTSLQLKPIEEALTRSGMPFVKLSDDLLCTKKAIRNLLKNLNDSTSIAEQIKHLKNDFKEEIDSFIWEYLEKLAVECSSKNDFIHEVSLLKESDTIDSRADRISLMTLHSSKGLEFNCVFIAGLENGLIPLYKAETEKELEEEKRLLYVGMTRAKQLLFLTRAKKRHIFGRMENREISPFLEKIESDLLQLTNFDKEYKKTEKDNINQLSLF